MSEARTKLVKAWGKEGLWTVTYDCFVYDEIEDFSNNSNFLSFLVDYHKVLHESKRPVIISLGKYEVVCKLCLQAGGEPHFGHDDFAIL